MTKKKMCVRRATSFILALVIVLSLVPITASAAYSPSDMFEETAAAGIPGLPYDKFHADVEAYLTQYYGYVMNGMTDANGVQFGGLNNTQVSDAFVIENLMKYLVTLWWANSNVLYDSDGKDAFNAFFSTGINTPSSSWFNDDIRNQLPAIQSAARAHFQDTENVYGTASSNVIYDYLSMSLIDGGFNSEWTLPDTITPGVLYFGNVVQGLKDTYILQNITNILANELDEARLQEINSGGLQRPNVDDEIDVTLGLKINTDADASASSDAPASIYVLGDSVLFDTIEAVKGTTAHEHVDNGTIGVVTSTPGHRGYSYASNMIRELTASSVTHITDLYIVVGYDVAGVTKEDDTPDDRKYHYEQLISTFLSELTAEKYPNLKNISFVAAPEGTGTDYDDYIKEYNKTVSEYIVALDDERVHLLDSREQLSGDITEDGKRMWSHIVSNALAPDESTPSGVTLGSRDAVAVYNLYNKYADQLRPYFDVYEHVLDYAEMLWSNGYANTNITNSGVTDNYVAYHKPLNTTVFTFGDTLAGALYEVGYKSDDKANQAATPTIPDEEVDDDYIAQKNTPLELISNAMILDTHEIIVPDGEISDAELNVVGYAALAAGVTYDPFVSIAGNEAYIETVKYSLQGAEDDSLEKIERILHEAFSRKKPLYVLDGSKSSWPDETELNTAPTGDYRFAYLADVLQHDVATTRVYTVVKGGMVPSSVDSSTWEYITGGSSGSFGTGTSSGVASETTDNVVYVQSNSSGASDEDRTVAGSQLMATSQQMSAPVMFTSGAKNGAWTGNWDGSASGYAASLGGLTTVIIHNAAQDAKSNQYVQHPETSMLFMNGLGDIVLADGTIVLPAIANPVIYNYDSIQYDVDTSASWETYFGSVGGAVGGALVAGGIAALIAGTGGLATPVIVGICAGGAAVGGTTVGTVGAEFIDSFGEADAPDVVQDAYDSSKAYYPYTAAFMNHYPSAIINGSGKLAVVNANDEGKYMLGIDEVGNVVARRIASLEDNTTANLQYSGGGITVSTVQGLSFNVTDNPDAIGTALPYIHGDDGTFASNFNTANKFEYYMVKDTIYSGDDVSFFPLNADIADLKDSYLMMAGALVTSAKRFLTERESAGAVSDAHPTFDVAYYIEYMAGQGLQGTQYSETLQKNYQISYDELVADTGGRFLAFFVQLTESAMESLGKIDGVLAIKNCYENKFFNMIVQFIQEFYLLIAVVLLIVVAVKFLRGHYNILFVAFIAAVCVCGFELYANWMPTMVPAAYNFAVNDAIEQVVWNTVAVSAESYEETYRDSDRVDTTSGAPKPYTATMTLYKMTRADMEIVAGRLGTTYTALKSGEVFYLDETAGIFVQGDSIKISVDKLLVNNTMRGLYFTQWEELADGFTNSDDFITPITDEADQIGNPYSIQLTQPYVSLEAYYMPYNEIERAFMINLNAFASIFRMERNQYSYGRDLYKDSFLFNCFTNSGIFTAPGDKDVLRENIKVGSVIGPYGSQEDNVTAMLNRVYGGGDRDPVFEYPDDWLNIAAVLRSPSANMKTSLWGRTMQDRGWYTDDWTITNPKGVDELGNLIAYINEQTKQFVIQNSEQLNYCSDENAIKIVSMYATTCFTHYVSEFGDWLYPNYLNAADIELKDVLYGSMTTLKDRNFAQDGTVVNTVAYNLGVFGVLFLLLIIVLATVFVFVMTYLVPILYALFGGILVYKLINDKEGIGLVQGYIKVTGVTCLLYFIFSLSLRLVEVGGYAWYGYLGCALIMFLCCYFLFWVCLSVVQNIGEMGNEVLGQNLLRGFERITGGAVRRLTAGTIHARRGIRGYGGYGYGDYGYGSPYMYSRGYGVDNRDFIRGSRSGFGFGGLGGRRGYRGPDYGSYGRGALYDDGMYERESRRGAERIFESAARLEAGMSRYAHSNRRRNNTR